MKLSQGIQISYSPITLPIGNIRKPKLKDIADTQSVHKMSFEKFYYYEFLISITPEEFFKSIKDGKNLWESFDKEEREKLTLYQLVMSYEELAKNYLNVFSFFFEETILLLDNVYVVVNPNKDYNQEKPLPEDVKGIINAENFDEVISIIQQICCITPKQKEEKPKFKNKTAERIYYQIKEAEENQKKKVDENLTLPNIISSVSVEHKSLNYTNIWELTIFQLLDNFARLRDQKIQDIIETRVAVWGDEDNKYDPYVWYKNDFNQIINSEKK